MEKVNFVICESFGRPTENVESHEAIETSFMFDTSR